MKKLVRLLMELDKCYNQKNCPEMNFFLQELSKYANQYVNCLWKDAKYGKMSDNCMERIDKEGEDINTILETKELFTDITNKVEKKLSHLINIFSDEEIQEYLSHEQFYKDHKLSKFSYEELHHRICKCIFKSIEKCENPGNKKKYFYIQLGHEDISTSENGDIDDNLLNGYIRLSILSYKSLSYDRIVYEILRSQNSELIEIIREIYKPYFIEYYISTKDLTKEQKEFIFQDDEEVPGMGVWHEACFISDQGSQTINEGHVFDGVYSYSSSPVVYKGKKIWINDQRMDNRWINSIRKIYYPAVEKASDEKIKEIVENIFNEVNFKRVRIYKVGNGNCIYCYGKVGKNSKRLIYDIGFDNKTAIREDIKSMPFPYQAAISQIRRSLPDCIILSHWDEDHYKACVYSEREIYDCTWIAPDFYDAGVNAKRLGVYLSAIHKLLLVDRSNARAIHINLNSSSSLTLYIGHKSEHITKQNCEGIAIKIENKKTKGNICCLMQGDVPYSSLPDEAMFEVGNPYDYLVVPHHGSKMVYKLLVKEKAKSGKAVICCNDDINKGRPVKEHYERLKDCYEKVKMTENTSAYLEFNLTRKYR